MNHTNQVALYAEVEKIAKARLLGGISNKVRSARAFAKNLPLDEKAAFLSGMFLNPIPGMSVTQLAALRAIKSHIPGAIAKKTQGQMQAALSKIKTPKNIVGK